MRSTFPPKRFLQKTENRSKSYTTIRAFSVCVLTLRKHCNGDHARGHVLHSASHVYLVPPSIRCIFISVFQFSLMTSPPFLCRVSSLIIRCLHLIATLKRETIRFSLESRASTDDASLHNLIPILTPPRTIHHRPLPNQTRKRSRFYCQMLRKYRFRVYKKKKKGSCLNHSHSVHSATSQPSLRPRVAAIIGTFHECGVPFHLQAPS